MVTAEELQKSGHLEQAISLYEKARSDDPSVKFVAHRLAVLYDAQGDSARSLAEFNKALESDPKNPSLLSDFGYYYYERGNQAEAERLLRQALAIDANHSKALCNLGLVLAAGGRLDESFQAFSKVVGPAAAHSNLGVLLAKQGRYDQARQAFHQALALDATLPQPKAFLAYLDRPQPGR
jgi:Flp pilus assembly protein TadD